MVIGKCVYDATKIVFANNDQPKHPNGTREERRMKPPKLHLKQKSSVFQQKFNNPNGCKIHKVLRY